MGTKLVVKISAICQLFVDKCIYQLTVKIWTTSQLSVNFHPDLPNFYFLQGGKVRQKNNRITGNTSRLSEVVYCQGYYYSHSHWGGTGVGLLRACLH